jgi:hypothetical protein
MMEMFGAIKVKSLWFLTWPRVILVTIKEISANLHTNCQGLVDEIDSSTVFTQNHNLLFN